MNYFSLPGLFLRNEEGKLVKEGKPDVYFICQRIGFPFSSLRERTRRHDVVKYRQLAQYIMFEIGYKITEISEIWNMHHTTFYNSRKSIKNVIHTNIGNANRSDFFRHIIATCNYFDIRI